MTDNNTRGHWLNAWHIEPSSHKDYYLVDGLRGIAILLVVGCHFVAQNPLSSFWKKLAMGIISAGAVGVPIFFTISGFLISWPFWKRKAKGLKQVIPPGYAWRRFYKIYPPLALSILLLTPIYIFRSHDWSFCSLAAQWLVGVPLVVPVKGSLNPVMWSLVVEVQFYLLLPVIFYCFTKISIKNCLWLVFGTLFIGSIFFGYVYSIYGLKNGIHPEIACYFPSLLDAFSFGVLLAGLENYWGGLPRQWASFGDWGFIALGILLIAISYLHLLYSDFGYALYLALRCATEIISIMLLCYIANPKNPRARLLSHPGLRWIGIISYEWYLFHQPIVLWARESFGPINSNPVKYVAICGVSFVLGLGIAIFVYRYFSLPILKFGRARHMLRQ